MEISLLYGRRELVAKVNQVTKLPPEVKILPTLEVGTMSIVYDVIPIYHGQLQHYHGINIIVTAVLTLVVYLH